jgi:hypothetical protein
MVIASRCVPGAKSDMALGRMVISRILNGELILKLRKPG